MLENGTSPPMAINSTAEGTISDTNASDSRNARVKQIGPAQA